jgi:hypothetical protein
MVRSIANYDLGYVTPSSKKLKTIYVYFCSENGLVNGFEDKKSTWEEISNITSDGWINQYDRLLLNSRDERNDKLVIYEGFFGIYCMVVCYKFQG